ncbi:MAG: GNAT family N-acetyltransferase [Candidatus Shapirobacteria bacterium]
MENCNIRPITLEDFATIREIDIETQIQYLGQEKWEQLTPEEKEEHLVVSESNFEEFVKNRLCFLAQTGGKVIGFILAYETVPIYGEVYCRYIGISPERQGKGIGIRLFEKLIEAARDNKMKKIWSLINPDNPNSIKAHERVGFEIRDRKEAEYKI